MAHEDEPVVEMYSFKNAKSILNLHWYLGFDETAYSNTHVSNGAINFQRNSRLYC